MAAQKIKFSIKDFFSQWSHLLMIWSHLLKKSLMENFIFCAVIGVTYQLTDPLIPMHRALTERTKDIRERSWLPNESFADVQFASAVQHCIKNIRIRFYSGPYFSVFSQNAGKYGPD